LYARRIRAISAVSFFSAEVQVSESSGGDKVFDEPVDVQLLREGLPREYRMRADTHYVDQISASSSSQPVRMIPVSTLDGAGSCSPATLRPLLESIRRHGIVQPLLVRRQDGRFQVIAGRKRLVAATTLHLPTVPCLVQELTDAEAAGVAAADNLRITTADPSAAHSTDSTSLADTIGAHLGAVQECVDLCERGTGLQGPAFMLLQAHSWRASCLLNVFNMVHSPAAASPRRRPFAAVVADVIEGFEAEGHLSGISIRLLLRDHISLGGLDDRSVRAGLSGALLAVIPLLEQTIRPVLDVIAYLAEDGRAMLEISQTSAAVSQHSADHFFDPEGSATRPGGYAAMLGALAAKALAEAHGGDAQFERLQPGSRLTIIMKLAA
jgi:hypothetical protein